MFGNNMIYLNGSNIEQNFAPPRCLKRRTVNWSPLCALASSSSVEKFLRSNSRKIYFMPEWLRVEKNLKVFYFLRCCRVTTTMAVVMTI
jgi:hypothetical protein